MAKLIVYEKHHDGYGTVLLNREEKRNAISQQMAEQLNSLLAELKLDLPKFLVLKSAGDKVFCAGGDLNELNDELNETEAFSHLTPMREVLYQLATFPVPTICLLQGNAFGGGCELATACDIRIAKEGTKFGFIQSNLGILPGWGGGALLYQKVNPNFALQWITEGSTFTAEELKDKGWLHRIIAKDKWENEAEILTPYRNKSIDQLTFLKEQFLQGIGRDQLKAEMIQESRHSAYLWPSETHKEAVRSFLKK
ncbi:MAG TPA: enoyl-CoA hydratase/isomerase family protein [Pseudogracilibacillus sp.]|nr:enoyl-CoA hydratase/isomerase family protein [Pseudogracilibacillus sp.]